MKILFSDAFDPSLPAKLEGFGEVIEDKERLPEVDVVLVRSKTKCTRDYIDQAENLRLIIRGGVGLDNIDVEYARSKGIQVFNTASASAVAVAELAFALMIAVPRCCTVGMKLSLTHAESTCSIAASPLIQQWWMSGYWVAE